MRWAVRLAISAFVGLCEALAARRQPPAPVEERHAWDEWEPPPGRTLREVPVCMFCGTLRTSGNKKAACPKLSEPPQVQPGAAR